mgnify:FL=1
MDIIEIIEDKKNKKELSKAQIDYWIEEYCKDNIADYQVSALLMAIRLNGMSKREIFDLTEAMMHSGEIIDLSSIVGVKCDKHSTGGVGDKTSLALCPMVASLGIKVAKMSGRGLGFTGGTLDKLESIPGMSISLTPEEFINSVNKIGISIIGQSNKIDLADKKLYALRDVTGTVDSIPLIASSIMSKKLAAGCDCILLDVKYGSGAFMRTKAEAEELAKVMVEIGCHFNKDVRAEITSMNQPLGLAIGNILEVKEAIDTLKGKGPSDFTELCLSSGTTMLLQAKIFTDKDEARRALEQSISSGSAYNVFLKFIENQGGDTRYIEDYSLFPKAMYSYDVKADRTGYITSFDTMGLGLLSMHLGAGRETKEDSIDFDAGILLYKKLGDKVSKGDKLMTLYTDRDKMSSKVAQALNCLTISEENIIKPKVVEEVISYDSINKKFVIESE